MLRAIILIGILGMGVSGAVLIRRTIDPASAEVASPETASLAAAPQVLQPKAPAPKPNKPTPPALVEFTAASAAKARCPKDSVVWANTRSKAYFVKGDK